MLKEGKSQGGLNPDRAHETNDFGWSMACKTRKLLTGIFDRGNARHKSSNAVSDHTETISISHFRYWKAMAG